ncbi:MAG: DUF362 domain-containing protein [Candidatus Aminicenantes bacterium]
MKFTRREFLKGIATTGAGICIGGLANPRKGLANGTNAQVFKVEECPVHDNQRRHHGLDTLLDLYADNGLKFYKTNTWHPWGSPSGIIDADDVVLIKVNCQWKCRGTTNTDLVRGLVHRILKHPDGFNGEVVIFENGQGRGAFDGLTCGGDNYSAWPDIDNNVWINAEEENLLTVDYLVNTVFSSSPVSSYLLDPIRNISISASDHTTDGYRMIDEVSYPCFTSAGGNRIELREGLWTGSTHTPNLKLINVPVLKHHGGTGITGTLKHSYGILSMSDGYSSIRHYTQSGTQCGKMWSLVRIPDLNILDCIWVSHETLRGYPVETTNRSNILLASSDPIALDYHGSKHVLLPLGGSLASQHDPDSFDGLINHLTGARDFINANGGIDGKPTQMGDENIDVISAQPFPVGVVLRPSTLTVSKGGNLNLNAFFVNNTNQPQTVYFATRVKFPSGDPYPSPGYLYGPVQVDLNAYEIASENVHHTIPTNAPLGTYTYNGLIGTPGTGLMDKYTFNFEII